LDAMDAMDALDVSEVDVCKVAGADGGETMVDVAIDDTESCEA
jgi:hypothetical protein